LLFVAGFILKRAINYPFDFVLYPAALFWLGTVTGGLFMMALSVVFNTLLIRAYDWSETDWLAIEAIKEFRDSEDDEEEDVRAETVPE
jgi:hypothetical protein